jgi:hypothetical protein
MNKRAGTYDLIYSQTFWMMVIPFVLILVFSIAFFSELVKSDILYTDENLRFEFAQDRLFTGACFALYDHELMRAYPYVIDVDRFNDEILNSCLDTDIGFSLELKWIGSSTLKAKSQNFENFDIVRKREVIIFDGNYHKGEMVIMIDKKDK